MEVRELCDNIRADFISEIVPFLRMEPSTLDQLKMIQTSFLTVRRLLLTKTFYLTATIVERNVLEYIMINMVKEHDVTVKFGKRVVVRFISTSVAASMTERLFKGSIDPFKLFVKPAINGVLGVVMLIWQSPREAEQWVRRDWPKLYRFLNEKAHLQDFKHLVLSVHEFVNSPKTSFEYGRSKKWQRQMGGQIIGQVEHMHPSDFVSRVRNSLK